MSQMIKQNVSVLLGTVPLFAVNRIALDERYELPPVGDKGASQSTSKITREVQIEAVLIGDERQATRLGLEAMADVSKTLPLGSSILSGHSHGRRASPRCSTCRSTACASASRRKRRMSTP